ncbi:DUF541 domain-containing protein [Olsenella sp. SW781]|uniref:SIMPL domain-containing protein n=1 Tax=Olsenella sp. SW781 TaxID=2530046 RepID=UPI001438F7AA|nr:SIMPL domain-containing protein [Olsenella sp. SW781]NJE81448.1 DUF541 domain-containing protein [Olsenella sp. SW781]
MSSIEKPVICVSASVEEQVEPDIAEFVIRFEWHGQDQAECAERYATDAARAKEALEALGLGNELKLSHYSSYANRRRHGRTSGGFEYSAHGSLRIRLSEHDVASVWTALANSGARASINVYFSLDDEDAEEAKLLGQAVAKARGSAEALAAASEKRLGEVRQIRYNRPTDGYTYPGGFCMERTAGIDSN